LITNFPSTSRPQKKSAVNERGEPQRTINLKQLPQFEFSNFSHIFMASVDVTRRTNSDGMFGFGGKVGEVKIAFHALVGELSTRLCWCKRVTVGKRGLRKRRRRESRTG
jgi:hypothetical protein